ncbi:hypothetical protein B0H16DRAFT_154271 [Mycena metata]|uniref:Uncharacterized protein n=1 Tax=Mycena metata TaxID=1033252 RepID=A0AAD7I583_9AGAR|nr:hypothetical protein B0H16DRAFT_154271 [Mycena metata]
MRSSDSPNLIVCGVQAPWNVCRQILGLFDLSIDVGRLMTSAFGQARSQVKLEKERSCCQRERKGNEKSRALGGEWGWGGVVLDRPEPPHILGTSFAGSSSAARESRVVDGSSRWRGGMLLKARGLRGACGCNILVCLLLTYRNTSYEFDD